MVDPQVWFRTSSVVDISTLGIISAYFLKGRRRCLGIGVSGSLLTRPNSQDADFRSWLRIGFYIIITTNGPSHLYTEHRNLGRPQKPHCPATSSVQDVCVCLRPCSFVISVSPVERQSSSAPCFASVGDVSSQAYQIADQQADSSTLLRRHPESAQTGDGDIKILQYLPHQDTEQMTPQRLPAETSVCAGIDAGQCQRVVTLSYRSRDGLTIEAPSTNRSRH
jgi:hypothetical protein